MLICWAKTNMTEFAPPTPLGDNAAVDPGYADLRAAQLLDYQAKSRRNEVSPEAVAGLDLLTTDDKHGKDPDILDKTRDQLMSEVAETDARLNKVVAGAADGKKYWGAEFPTGFVFSGGAGIRANKEYVSKDWAAKMGVLANSGQPRFTHVYVEMDDGSMLCFARTNDRKSAAAQEFEVTSTNMKPNEEGKIEPRTVASGQLRDTVLEPGKPLVTDKDPATGKVLRTRGNILKITAINAAEEVASNHPWVDKEDVQRSVIDEFQNRLDVAAQAEDPSSARVEDESYDAETVPPTSMSDFSEKMDIAAENTDGTELTEADALMLDSLLDYAAEAFIKRTEQLGPSWKRYELGRNKMAQDPQGERFMMRVANVEETVASQMSDGRQLFEVPQTVADCALLEGEMHAVQSLVERIRQPGGARVEGRVADMYKKLVSKLSSDAQKMLLMTKQ